MNLTVRHITEEEVPSYRQQIANGFGESLHDADAGHFTKVFELPRLIAAFDGVAMVGSAAAFTFDVTVPGGTLPMAGTTIITVLPTHRRKGVLTAMMRAHFDEILARKEPLAGLWASESAIYGRFGYGIAATLGNVKIDASKATFRNTSPTGSCRMIDLEEARTVLPEVYERVRPHRPGMLSRSADWWEHRKFRDKEHQRGGATPKRYVVFESDNSIDGYVVYRQKEKWQDFPTGDVTIHEVIAATPDAHEGLWQFLLKIDLFPNVSYENVPSDDELPFRLSNHRRVRTQPMDSMWIRLMDIPRAMSERTYDAHGRLVLGITDPFLPDNTGAYELIVDANGSRCTRTDATPDITMDVDILATIYLGGTRPSLLARTGLIKGDAAAIAAADRIFSQPIAPWCPEMF